MTTDRAGARALVRPLLCGTLAVAAAVAATPARAALGGDYASIEADRARLAGAPLRPLALRAGAVQAHEIRLADGSSIRQYVDANGIVFAVAWSTRFKPDLTLLLGRHAASYQAAAAEAAKAPGIKRAAVLQRDDLVVRASTHLNNYVGTAYVRSLAPAGIDPDALH